MFKCPCGKEYKREDFYKKHIESCPYYDLDEKKVLYIGEKILDCYNVYYPNRKLLKECVKQFGNKDDCYKLIKNDFIMKYKKMFWDIYKGLSNSIPNKFLSDYFCWLKRKYKFDERILGIKLFVLNKKRLYRYIIENLDKIVEYQLEKDLELISELYKEYGKINEYFVEEMIVNKDVSYYFMVLNDYFNEVVEKNRYHVKELEYISEILFKINDKKLKKLYKKVNKNNKIYFIFDNNDGEDFEFDD
jgi:hypothetical protein